MKTLITITFCFLLVFQSFAQWQTITFDDSTYLDYIFIDTISNTNNIWQVGQPEKTIFTEAHSLPNAIVTDTSQPYPINDTSVFLIRYITPPPGGDWEGTSIHFTFKVDCDEDSDFGKIGFSPDNGESWIDYLTDTIYNNYYQGSEPYFTGLSEDWQYFWFENDPYWFDINPGDTIWYKITFISDSVDTERDGFIIDNIDLSDIYESIEENLESENHSIIISPNPANEGIISFKLRNNEFHKKLELKCFDVFGKEVYSESFRNQDEIQLDITNWESGIYISTLYTNGVFLAHGKFVVQ